MLTGLLLTLTLVMRLFPETALARSLHRRLIEWPLTRLAALDRRHVILVFLVAGVVLFASDLVFMLGSSDLAVALAWDVSIYADALLAACALAAVARGKAAWRALLIRAVSRPRRPRVRSRRPVRAQRPTSNDSDEEGPAWSPALAA
jgi:hypothetical protein